jgi:AraC family transcriptional regulator, transcriptional activator of pobA
MDGRRHLWHYPAMRDTVPTWHLYGEDSPFPDLLHIERIVDRAAGLDWRIAPHRHLHLHQFLVVGSGHARVTLDGTVLDLTAGHVLNVPRGAVHSFAFTAGLQGHVLTLATADFPELFGTGADTAAALARPFIAPATGFADRFDALAVLHDGRSSLRHRRLRACAVDLACAVVEASGAAAQMGQPGDPRIAALAAQVQRELASGWTLADHACALGMSERHLRRLTLRATGMTAQALIDGIRLQQACRMLAYTGMQVQQVGFALGFDDPAYFGRVFRRGTGLSPGAYRARLGGG